MLKRSEWRSRADAHRRRVRDLLGGMFYDRKIHDRHPIYNFLFNYYRFRPHMTIERYSAGLDFVESCSSSDDESLYHCKYLSVKDDRSMRSLYLPSSKYFSVKDGCIEMDPVKSLNEKSVTRIRNLFTLLEIVQRRPPNFSCFGVHEFAMLHSGARHSSLSEKSGSEIAHVTTRESMMLWRELRFDVPLRRYTALSKSALKSCRIKTSPDLRTKNEQAGCIHTNLDLFKFSLRLWPFASSELVADALELAIRARELDMRASPYDLSSVSDFTELGRDFDLTPVLIETESGRAEFRDSTMVLYRDSLPIRDRLIKVASSVLDCVSSTSALKSSSSMTI